MVREARFSIPHEMGFEIPELREDYLNDLDSISLEPDSHPEKETRKKLEKQKRESRYQHRRAS